MEVVKIKVLVIVTALLAPVLCAHAQTYVDPYVKQDGTYVQGHYKTPPNTTKVDN